MNLFKELVASLPRPVRIWTLSVLIALAYILFRFFLLGGKDSFLLIDRVVAVYAVLGTLIFLGFFMTRDPE